jgi:hypothetical protein
MSYTIEEFDIVMIKNPVLTVEKQSNKWIVSKMYSTHVGHPCCLTRVSDGMRSSIPYPIDCLELVEKSNMSNVEKKLVELEKRIKILESQRT